jgi:peptide/nickel transport system permease protein
MAEAVDFVSIGAGDHLEVLEADAAPATDETHQHRHRGFVRQALGLGRTRVGLFLVFVVVAVALVGPYVAPYDPTEFVGSPYSPPGGAARLGTDYLGRDVLSRFLSGGQTILVLGFLGTTLGVCAGTLLGLFAGYSMRMADEFIMRLVDLLLAFPSIVFSLLLITVIGPYDWVIVLVVGLSFMPYTARVVRASTIQVRESDFVKYVEATGTPTRKILVSEILPNISASLTVEFGLRLTQSVGLIAGLAYLGLGVSPPTPDWGLMIQENQIGLTSVPLAVLLPVTAIALITIGANLVTDGLGQAAAGADRSVADT